jgi:competence protein ComEA
MVPCCYRRQGNLNQGGSAMKWKVWLMAMIASVAMFVSAPAWSNETVNVNTATVEQLQTVKGIGPKLAAAIVDYRHAHGNFESVDALTGVKGIGDKKLDRIREGLRTDDEEDAGVE